MGWWDDVADDLGEWWDVSTSAVEDDPLYTDLDYAADYAKQTIRADSDWTSVDIELAEGLVDEAAELGGDGDEVAVFWDELAALWGETDPGHHLTAWDELGDFWTSQAALTRKWWGIVDEYGAGDIVADSASDAWDETVDAVDPRKSVLPWLVGGLVVLALWSRR